MGYSIGMRSVAWMVAAAAAVACMAVESSSDEPPGSGGSGGSADAGHDTTSPEDGALCWPGQKWCGACVETTDPDHGCGSTACDPCVVAQGSAKCESDQCSVKACDVGYADCNKQAADGCEINTEANHEHCGGCGKTCAASEVCLAGSCASNCGALTNCSGSCVNTATDPQHCGGCGSPCAANQTCQSGACACTSGLSLCSGACVDTKTSKQHCGTCGKACTDPPNGVASCSNGSCVLACFGGTTLCGSQCVTVSSSTSHCGGCNKACAAGETCQDGWCAASFQASADFSGVQGTKGWSYLSSDGSPMVFDASKNWWQGAETYLLLNPSGGHPGAALDAVRRWTATKTGNVKITGKAYDGHAGCGSDGVNVSIRKGASVLWQNSVAKDDGVGVSFDVATSVAPGDKLDFVINKGIDDGCDSTVFNPTIALSYKP